LAHAPASLGVTGALVAERLPASLDAVTVQVIGRTPSAVARV
jgi:hypothetical protein